MIALVLALAAMAGPRTDGPGITLLAGEDWARRCYLHAVDTMPDEDAVRDCDRAVASQANIRGNLGASVVNRGVVRFRLGDYRAAADDFTLAIDGFGMKTARVFINRGLAWEMASGPDLDLEGLARADYARALKLDPDNEVALERLRQLERPYIEREVVFDRAVTS
ncbi:hypothetical protein [Parvularcula dongshanensis]|uniref:Tetratricopeptide (TPR) repeat protein n=1 Tax=Parvularcula dongshanensis TaxID=1173995 RepID=A0A840I2H4_9PROT|nr:hypothetical protein [Parvularcula dongshanensis]MBB4658535.1 tetratricopeptide (TPR) repeat protein [Parvularcula dongshanensis]